MKVNRLFERIRTSKSSGRRLSKAEFVYGGIVLALVIYMIIDSVVNGYVSDNPGFW